MRSVSQNWLNPGQNTIAENVKTRAKNQKSFKSGKSKTISGARKRVGIKKMLAHWSKEMQIQEESKNIN